jgi:hypothetical protein
MADPLLDGAVQDSVKVVWPLLAPVAESAVGAEGTFGVVTELESGDHGPVPTTLMAATSST